MAKVSILRVNATRTFSSGHKPASTYESRKEKKSIPWRQLIPKLPTIELLFLSLLQLITLRERELD